MQINLPHNCRIDNCPTKKWSLIIHLILLLLNKQEVTGHYFISYCVFKRRMTTVTTMTTITTVTTSISLAPSQPPSTLHDAKASSRQTSAWRRSARRSLSAGRADEGSSREWWCSSSITATRPGSRWTTTTSDPACLKTLFCIQGQTRWPDLMLCLL